MPARITAASKPWKRNYLPAANGPNGRIFAEGEETPGLALVGILHIEVARKDVCLRLCVVVVYMQYYPRLYTLPESRMVFEYYQYEIDLI